MALFGYLFDSNFKKQVEEHHKKGEEPDEVVRDPSDEAQTIRRLREDMARVLVLNRALITLLINNNVITLPELTELAKEINKEEEAEEASATTPEAKRSKYCKKCGRPNYRHRANCIYCGSLQL